jgi:molybdopterin-guanine dinucleotide biosynthesis protein A
MGAEKASLRVCGEPQVRRIASLLSRVAACVFVSVGEAQLSNPDFSGLQLLEDEEPGIGPLAGLLRAFHHERRAAWLVAAVDMPGITLATLERLIRARDPTTHATAYRSPLTGDPEPVCAIYEPSIFAALEEAKARGKYSLKVLKSLRVKLIDAESARELSNVNDPGEYEAWIKGG